MSKSLYVSMLRQGSNGAEILEILNHIVEPEVEANEAVELELQPVQF